MDIKDFDDVNKCFKILNSIDEAEESIRDHLSKFDRPDPGGIPNVADKGYSCHLSRYGDGSGRAVDLNGCYVGDEVYESTLKILLTKRRDILKHLEKLGVSTESWNS